MPHSTSSNPSPPTFSPQDLPTATTATTTSPTPTPPPVPAITTVTHSNPTLRTLNRRRTYLAQHPDYFTNPDLEYVNPLLYDRCIRAFQSAEAREAAGKERGWSAVLEAGLRRGEARLDRLRDRDRTREERGEDEEDEDEDEVDEEEGGKVRDKEEGERLWNEVIGERFLCGADLDFEYGAVDGDETLDVEERRDREEAWFDGEEESSVGAECQTGIQDF